MPPVIAYVNTDSTAGGDGTSPATSGANRAYATLNEGLDAMQRDCTSATGAAQGVDFICDGVADDTVQPTLSSVWKMDSNNFVRVIAANNHNGKWNTGDYRINAGSIPGAMWWSPNDGGSIHIVEFHGIQFSCSPANSAASSRHFIDVAVGNWTSGSQYRFIRCIFRQIFNAGYTANTCRCIRLGDADSLMYFNHCLFYGWQGTAISCGVNAAIRIYNCTFVDTTAAAVGVTGSVQGIRNCLFSGCASIAGGTLSGVSDYNATDLASGPTNFGTHSRLSQTFSFVDAANKDYHLTSGDVGAKGFAQTLTLAEPGLYILEDIDNQTRVAPWDIGADQYVPPAGGVSRTDITIRIYA